MTVTYTLDSVISKNTSDRCDTKEFESVNYKYVWKPDLKNTYIEHLESEECLESLDV